MTYVIGQPCVDVLDRACVEECPVDCIYEGARSLYIHPKLGPLGVDTPLVASMPPQTDTGAMAQGA